MVEPSDSNVAQLNDEAQMLRFREGDNEAFEHLFNKYHYLKAYTARRVNDIQTAENIVQEAWYKLIKAKKRYKPTAKFSTYLFTIVENLIIDNYRSEGKTSTYIDQDEDLELLPDTAKDNNRSVEDKAFLRECIKFLEQAISKLPSEQNQVLLLQLVTNMSLTEIGTVTDVERETVKSRLRYAHDKVKRMVPDDCIQVVL